MPSTKMMLTIKCVGKPYETQTHHFLDVFMEWSTAAYCPYKVARPQKSGDSKQKPTSIVYKMTSRPLEGDQIM